MTISMSTPGLSDFVLSRVTAYHADGEHRDERDELPGPVSHTPPASGVSDGSV